MQIVSRYNSLGKRTATLKFRKPSGIIKIKKPNTIIKIKRKNPKLNMKISTFQTLQSTYFSIVSFLYKYLFCFLTLLWMILIFMFSHQPSDVSSVTSSSLNNIFKEIPLFSLFFKLFPIRKVAHFFLYFCLGFLVNKSLTNLEIINKRYLQNIVTLLICFIYACTDEFHQLFILGRDGNIFDVLIDTSGALLTLIIINTIIVIKNKVRE